MHVHKIHTHTHTHTCTHTYTQIHTNTHTHTHTGTHTPAHTHIHTHTHTTFSYYSQLATAILFIFSFQYENFPCSSAALNKSNHTVITGKPVTYNYLEPESSVNGNVMPNVHKQLPRNECTATHIPNQYEADNTVVQAQTDEITFAHIPNHYETDKTLQFGGKLSNVEPAYKDPGHKKKPIYEWLERTKIFKFDKKTVRCLGILNTIC